jgi:hypothetical protein
MIAASTPLPVIGVPVKGSTLDGMDSLLSIVQSRRPLPLLRFFDHAVLGLLTYVLYLSAPALYKNHGANLLQCHAVYLSPVLQ